MECRQLFACWLCFAMVPLWFALVPSTLTKETENGMLRSALLLGDHLDKASLRATTTSQVIEYNARNIVLMTLLNSVLILGGLLGTVNRPEVVGFPFKRVDFGNLKKRFTFRRGSQRPTTTRSPSLAPASVLSSIGGESTAYLSGPPDDAARPPSALHMPSILFDEASLPVETLTYEPHPRAPVRASRRWASEEEKPSSQARSKPPSDAWEQQCSRVILCLDPNGKPYRPELSELTRTAVQVLNKDMAGGKSKRSALLDRVRELVELEQNGRICRWKTLCKTTPRPADLSPH